MSDSFSDFINTVMNWLASQKKLRSELLNSGEDVKSYKCIL